jgi:hypothetical protein
VTTPDPLPLLLPSMAIHGVLLAATQGHPEAAVIAIVPRPPAGDTAWFVGEIEYEHPTDWVTLNRWLPTAIVVVRGGPLLDATLKFTDAVPLPFTLDVNVIHGASVDAVHVHIWLEAITSIAPPPPACGKLAEGCRNCSTHAPASWLTSTRWLLRTMPPRRVTGSPLAATRYSIDPSPWPLFGPEMLSQVASEAADHAHSRALVT